MKRAILALLLSLSLLQAANDETPIVIDLKQESGKTVLSMNGDHCDRELLKKRLGQIFKAFGKDEYIQILVSKEVSIQELISLREDIIGIGYTNVRSFIPKHDKDRYFLQEITVHPQVEQKTDMVPPQTTSGPDRKK